MWFSNAYGCYLVLLGYFQNAGSYAIVLRSDNLSAQLSGQLKIVDQVALFGKVDLVGIL